MYFLMSSMDFTGKVKYNDLKRKTEGKSSVVSNLSLSFIRRAIK